MKIILFLHFFILCLILPSCSPSSSADYQTLARSEICRLTKTLKKIHDPLDLKRESKKLKKRFNKLARVMIDYRTFIEKHPLAPIQGSSKLEQAAFELKGELKRIYELDGAIDILENVQQDAYLKLSFFEQSLNQERIDMYKSRKPLTIESK